MSNIQILTAVAGGAASLFWLLRCILKYECRKSNEIDHALDAISDRAKNVPAAMLPGLITEIVALSEKSGWWNRGHSSRAAKIMSFINGRIVGRKENR